MTKSLEGMKVKSIITIEHKFDDYNSWAHEQKSLQTAIWNYVQNSLSAQEYDITFKAISNENREQ